MREERLRCCLVCSTSMYIVTMVPEDQLPAVERLAASLYSQARGCGPVVEDCVSELYDYVATRGGCRDCAERLVNMAYVDTFSVCQAGVYVDTIIRRGYDVSLLRAAAFTRMMIRHGGRVKNDIFATMAAGIAMRTLRGLRVPTEALAATFVVEDVAAAAARAVRGARVPRPLATEKVINTLKRVYSDDPAAAAAAVATAWSLAAIAAEDAELAAPAAAAAAAGARALRRQIRGKPYSMQYQIDAVALLLATHDIASITGVAERTPVSDYKRQLFSHANAALALHDGFRRAAATYAAALAMGTAADPDPRRREAATTALIAYTLAEGEPP